MDWGMARSGNIDTTKQMSQHLKMNYAYGVEFLELTNGNEREINATFGKHNHIGYHGNAVLSKWPILESKIVRLHSLFDLLYEEKTSGQAKGERRLGGRMALFTSIETFVGKILIISMHAHSGSSRNLLRGDAALVCDEIQRWNITNVIIGGDIATPIPKWLVSDCDFFALGKTNSRQEHGKGLTPTWKVGKIYISSLSVSS
jgi:endonuclease/exonuclease/phosphatase family metal-dependent hydrolase